LAQIDAPVRWRFGDAELDEVDARLTVAGEVVALDRSGFELLLCLLRNAGNVVGKDDLLRVGWPDRVVSENSLAKAIGRLRLALNDPEGERLRVVHGYGYRLIAPVERLAASATQVVDAQPPAAIEVLPAREPAKESNGTSSRRAWTLAMIGAALTLAVIGTIRIEFGPAQPAAAVPTASPDPGPQLASIAVLPFVDLSPQHDETYFSDGLAEQLLDDLSRVRKLRVVSRTSSFAFRGKEVDIQTIGRTLNVATVLEGSVRKSADRIRVTVQLINAADGYRLWSETYDRPITEIFAMQDDIARAIIAALRIELLPEQLSELAKHGTENPEAYAQWLLARHLFKDDETAERRSLAAYERAVELDPKFVEAWLGIADILGHSGIYADSAEEALAGKQRAMEAINHALELAPGRADVYLLRGDLKYAHWWDWQGGEDDLEHAAALTSHDNESYLIRLCRLRAAFGRMPEAIALARRATQVNPQSGGAWTVMGYHYTAMGEFQHAHDVLMQAVRGQPLDEHAHYYLGLGELLQGRAAAAMPHFENSAHFLRLTGLAIGYHSLGDAAASERNLQRLISQFGHITPYQAAEVYAWRGETDAAFEWLERAYQLRDASFMYIKFDPLLRSLHADPRYWALLLRLNLPS
jgi:TolB-like protein/DNA-binding winged helix-turn-helix (wHTH) protein